MSHGLFDVVALKMTPPDVISLGRNIDLKIKYRYRVPDSLAILLLMWAFFILGRICSSCQYRVSMYQGKLE